MDNFNYKKFLAEGKLYKETEALDRESVIDMAQMVADEFTEEDANVDGTHMIYKVGKVDGLEFELDTQATENTPADDAKYGTGEGWGGSFRIKVLPNGYEIRNSEKGGLVATMDMEDGFRMLSADESRAELEGEPDVDWKNDELDMKRMEEGILDKIKDLASIAGQGTDSYTRPSLGEEEIEEEKSSKMKKSELKEMIRAAFLNEAEGDEEEVELEDEVEVEDTDTEDVGEIDVEANAEVGITGDKKEVQDNLEAALEAAKALGDQKLADQIGNSITFFTRTHVVGTDQVAEEEINEAVSGDQEVILKGEFKAEDGIFNQLSDFKKGMKVVMRRSAPDMAKDYNRYAGVVDSIDQGRVTYTNALGKKMAADPADLVIVTNWGGPAQFNENFDGS